MGTGRGRKGGNPEIANFGFKSSSDESLVAQVQVMVKPSVKEFLQTLGKNKPQFLRDAIDKAIADFKDQGSHPL
jgi:hypothetical protein